jgi:hypothetical protein
MISSVILISSVVAVFMYFKPHRSVRNEEADFRLTVSELVNAFVTDEQKANAAYVGKVVEVRGTLKEMILNDSTLILLLGDSAEVTGVSCYLQKDQKEKYTGLKRGDIVMVKGVCNGMLLDVVIDKGLLLSPE